MLSGHFIYRVAFILIFYLSFPNWSYPRDECYLLPWLRYKGPTIKHFANVGKKSMNILKEISQRIISLSDTNREVWDDHVRHVKPQWTSATKSDANVLIENFVYGSALQTFSKGHFFGIKNLLAHHQILSDKKYKKR